MKKIFLILSVLFFGISVFGQTPVCPPIDPIFGVGALTQIGDPNNCSRFYICEHGIAVQYECPDGLYFDSRNQICTWFWEPNAVFDCVPGNDNSSNNDSDLSLNCITLLTLTDNFWWDCQECGRHFKNTVCETYECNDGIFSFCYPGYTITYYDCVCHGGGTTVNDFTEISTCF
jgi:hypothetical protein